MVIPGAVIAGPDARFWAAWREYKELEATWEADGDDSPANWENHAARVNAAHEAMLLVPVTTAQAVLAKYTDVASGAVDLRDGRFTSTQVIGWDLERLAKQEMFA